MPMSQAAVKAAVTTMMTEVGADSARRSSALAMPKPRSDPASPVPTVTGMPMRTSALTRMPASHPVTAPISSITVRSIRVSFIRS